MNESTGKDARRPLGSLILSIDSGVEKTINAGPRGRIEHFIPKEGYYSSKAL